MAVEDVLAPRLKSLLGFLDCAEAHKPEAHAECPARRGWVGLGLDACEGEAWQLVESRLEAGRRRRKIQVLDEERRVLRGGNLVGPDCGSTGGRLDCDRRDV